jgi:ribonuclease HI
MSRIFPANCVSNCHVFNDLSIISYYNCQMELTNLCYMKHCRGSRSYHRTINPKSILIHTDGACRDNGYASARASYGVYFGPNSKYNSAAVLDRNVHRQTNQYAELFGVLRALRIVRNHLDDWQDVGEVVIATDSQYVFDAMTRFVFKWRKNGWINCCGREVVNSVKFKEVDDIIGVLADEGVKVQFFWVPREYNREADELARDIL